MEEYTNSIGQALIHYRQTLDEARSLPSEDDTDPSSSMEAKVLNWLKSTSFVNAEFRAEIIPQFDLGRYLKSLDETYEHPLYKTDFLLRLKKVGFIK